MRRPVRRERSPERVNTRNGYRGPEFDPRRHHRSRDPHAQRDLLPDWLLERRKRAEAAPATVVVTSYLLGVSTRRMDKLLETLRNTRLSGVGLVTSDAHAGLTAAIGPPCRSGVAALPHPLLDESDVRDTEGVLVLGPRPAALDLPLT